MGLLEEGKNHFAEIARELTPEYLATEGLRIELALAELEAGQRWHLDIPKVAGRLGISQEVAKQALQALQQEGIITIIQHEGIRMQRPDHLTPTTEKQKQLEEVYSTLFTKMANHAAEMATLPDIKRIEDALRQEEKFASQIAQSRIIDLTTPTIRPAVRGFIVAELFFHHTTVLTDENKTMHSIAAQRSIPSWLSSLNTGVAVQSRVQSDRTIAQAIRARDPQVAQEAARGFFQLPG